MATWLGAKDFSSLGSQFTVLAAVTASLKQRLSLFYGCLCSKGPSLVTLKVPRTLIRNEVMQNSRAWKGKPLSLTPQVDPPQGSLLPDTTLQRLFSWWLSLESLYQCEVFSGVVLILFSEKNTAGRKMTMWNLQQPKQDKISKLWAGKKKKNGWH